MTRTVPVLLLVAAAMLAASPFLIDAAPPEADPWMGLVPATPLFATTIDPATIRTP